MGVYSQILVATVSKAVNPTPTELDKWVPGTTTASRIAFENLDVAQTYNGWLESRPNAGSGNFSAVGETNWSGVSPLEPRDQATPDSAIGAGELRFMASASGAGGTCNYTRRSIRKANT